MQRARETETERLVVLKEFPLAPGRRDEDIMRSLRASLKVFTQVQHPSILALDAVISDGASLYLQFEFSRHGSLREVMDARPGSLSAQQKVSTAREVAEALAHLHRLDFIHGDVKPDNILVPALGRGVLCDFETSKGAKPGAAVTITHVTRIVENTNGYRAPEGRQVCRSARPGCDFSPLDARFLSHTRPPARPPAHSPTRCSLRFALPDYGGRRVLPRSRPA